MRGLSVTLVVAMALRLLLALFTDIYPDEAYYWSWSKHLQLSYFDHPALIAWQIAALGIRFSALLFGAATLVGVFQLARAAGGTPDQAWWATALFASTPASLLLGTIATPDAPLLCFWVWTLWALLTQRTVLIGVLWGFAMLSKYNGILLGLPVLLALWRKPPQLIAATGIAFVVTSPTIIWNALNDWEGFRFQFAHGLGGGGSLATFLEFIGGQFGLAGPIFLGLTIFWLARGDRNAVLKWATALPVLFFGYASVKARGEANWTAAAWLSASVGIALLPWRKWLRAALGLNLALIVGVVAFLCVPIAASWRSPPVQKLHGWAALAELSKHQLPTFTDRYQLSAMVSYYSGLDSTTFGGRRSQYDLWPRPKIATGGDALWVSEWGGPPQELVDRFERHEQLDWPLDDKQRALHPFQVWKLSAAKPH